MFQDTFQFILGVSFFCFEYGFDSGGLLIIDILSKTIAVFLPVMAIKTIIKTAKTAQSLCKSVIIVKTYPRGGVL